MNIEEISMTDLDPEVLSIWMTRDEEPAEVKPCHQVVECETIKHLELAELTDYLLKHPVLENRDAYILRKLFFENYTQKDVALALGISQQRLWELKRRAAFRLRRRRVISSAVINDLFA